MWYSLLIRCKYLRLLTLKCSCAFDDVSKVSKTNTSQVNCKQINTLYCFSKLVLTVLPYIFISSSIKCNSINFDHLFSFRQLHNFLGVIHIWCLLWGRLRQNWDVIGLTGVGEGRDFLDVESFFFFIKENWIWPKNEYIIDKISSFWLWRQTVKPSFNDTTALFVG